MNFLNIKNLEDEIQLEEGDRIEVELEGEPTQATIISRGRLGGNTYNHFNVAANGLEYNISLQKNPWKKVQAEQAMIVMIPRAQQGNSKCRVLWKR